MSTLTLRIADEKHDRLRQLAASQGISMNHLLDELATIALAQHDSELHFRLRAKSGSKRKGLLALAKLESHFSI